MRFFFEDPVHNKGEMRAFRAIAIAVTSLIVNGIHSFSEPTPCFVYLGRNFGKVGYLQRCSEPFDNVVKRYIMKQQLIILKREILSWKVERLFDQVPVSNFHLFNAHSSAVHLIQNLFSFAGNVVSFVVRCFANIFLQI